MGEGIEWSEWEKIFLEHGTSAKFSNKYGSYEAPIARSEAMDESKTRYYRKVGEETTTSFKVACYGVDMAKMGEMMGSPTFESMRKDMKMTDAPPMMLKPMPPSEAEPSLAAIMEVKDFDVWYAGFMQHASSTNVAGLTLPVSRSQMCDDSKTEVYRNGNNVCLVMQGVRMEVIGQAMADPEFMKLTEALGEIAESKQMYVLEAMPPPPTDA